MYKFFHKAFTYVLRFSAEKKISVVSVPGGYSLSGAVTGINVDVDVNRGDVLKFSLDVGRSHPFWIKTKKGTGKQNAVSTGISGVGQGKWSGELIWDTTAYKEGTYYYQCEYHANMVGKINVSEKTGMTLFKIQLMILLHYLTILFQNMYHHLFKYF